MPKDFGVFETIRKVKYGGTMRAIHKDLSPKLIKEYPEPFELVVVEVNVHSKNNNKKILVLAIRKTEKRKNGHHSL